MLKLIVSGSPNPFVTTNGVPALVGDDDSHLWSGHRRVDPVQEGLFNLVVCDFRTRRAYIVSERGLCDLGWVVPHETTVQASRDERIAIERHNVELFFEMLVEHITHPSPEQVERMAEAIYASDGGGDSSRWPSPTAETYRRRARAALETA